MTTNQYRYYQLKSRGLCVACRTPVEDGKTRCPACMKKTAEASYRSQKKRLLKMQSRIEELEARLGI